MGAGADQTCISVHEDNCSVDEDVVDALAANGEIVVERAIDETTVDDEVDLNAELEFDDEVVDDEVAVDDEVLDDEAIVDEVAVGENRFSLRRRRNNHSRCNVSLTR